MLDGIMHFKEEAPFVTPLSRDFVAAAHGWVSTQDQPERIVFYSAAEEENLDRSWKSKKEENYFYSQRRRISKRLVRQLPLWRKLCRASAWAFLKSPRTVREDTSTIRLRSAQRERESEPSSPSAEELVLASIASFLAIALHTATHGLTAQLQPHFVCWVRRH